MNQPQIDAARIVLRSLRFLDDTRRAADQQWQRITGRAKPANPKPPADRRQSPDLW